MENKIATTLELTYEAIYDLDNVLRDRINFLGKMYQGRELPPYAMEEMNNLEEVRRQLGWESDL